MFATFLAGLKEMAIWFKTKLWSQSIMHGRCPHDTDNVPLRSKAGTALKF